MLGFLIGWLVIGIILLAQEKPKPDTEMSNGSPQKDNFAGGLINGDGDEGPVGGGTTLTSNART